MSRTFDEHADLYDLAFTWDTAADAEWLLDRLGRSSRVLLEPGCGSGRMFPELARRGVSVIGIDRSETMLERARVRLLEEGLEEPRLECVDMAAFDLGEVVDGAYCPINTLGYLSTVAQAASHLACVAAHLRPRARYMVQVDLADLRDHRVEPPDEHSRWEVDGPDGRLRCTCYGVSWDPERRVERQACRFEILSGPRAGEVHEDVDDVLLWDWATWSQLIAESPFEQAAAYEGRRVGAFGAVEVGPSLEGVRLAWHELVHVA